MTSRRTPIVVSFSGLDGAGKTTQIDNLRELMHSLGLRETMLTFWDNIVVLSCVVHYQFASAAPAPQQTAQKSRATLNSAGSLPSTHIVTNRQLNLFELLPADIARVRTRN